MEEETNEGHLNEEGCRHEQQYFDEIKIIPPIQSPPRSDFTGPSVLPNLRKQFKCLMCNYSAKKQCNLFRHLSTHGRNQEYKGEMCNFSSISKLSLKNHTKYQHLQLFADKNDEEFINKNWELKFSDEDSESDSLTYELEPMKEGPLLTSTPIVKSLEKKRNLPIRKQQHPHPFFNSHKRERKWRFNPLGLPFSSQKQKVIKSLTMKSLEKPNIPFQPLTRLVERPITRVKKSTSSLAEKSLRSKIVGRPVGHKGASNCKRDKMVYKCPKCDYTVENLARNARRIEQHEKNHERNGRHKCNLCSFSHNRLNILTFQHKRFHHRVKVVEPNNEESVQLALNGSDLPENDGMENGDPHSSTLEEEETIHCEALEVKSPDSTPGLRGPIVSYDLGSPGSPPDLGEQIVSYDLIGRPMNCVIEYPDSPPVLQARVSPDTRNSEQVEDVVVEISTISDGFGIQSQERNQVAEDESFKYDIHFASERPEREALSEEDAEVEQQVTSHNGSFQETSFLLESDAFDSLMKMGDDLVDQVLSSENNNLEPGLSEAMPESSQISEIPNWNYSDPRITAANEWIEHFNLFYEEVKELKRNDLECYHSGVLRAQLVGSETECRMLFKEFNAEVELERTANKSRQQPPIFQGRKEKEDHPDIRKTRSKVVIAREAIQSVNLSSLPRIREEEKELREKIQTTIDTRSGLEDALLRELEMNQEFLESLVFKTEAEMTRRQKTVESIKENLKEVEKHLESLLTEERNVSECRQRVFGDLIVAYEQQCVNPIKSNGLVPARKSTLLFYQEELDRFPFSTEKMEICKKLNSCLLKIAQELNS